MTPYIASAGYLLMGLLTLLFVTSKMSWAGNPTIWTKIGRSILLIALWPAFWIVMMLTPMEIP